MALENPVHVRHGLFLPTPFLVLFGATYFFAEFGPNTTTFVYPAEIFPVRVRTTAHGVAAAAGKAGAFIGITPDLAATRRSAWAKRASSLQLWPYWAP